MKANISTHLWHLSTAIWLLLGSARGGEVIRELDRFGDSQTGKGTIVFESESRGDWKITVLLEELRPNASYRLSLNALPQMLENQIFGTLHFPTNSPWKPGQIFDNPITGEKEGYWDFAVVTANATGAVRQEFHLPLPPKQGGYNAKFLIKESFGNGSVILQCPWLSFIVRERSIVGRAMSLVWWLSGLAAIVICALVYVRSRRQKKITASLAVAAESAVRPSGASADGGIPAEITASKLHNVFRWKSKSNVWLIYFNGEGPFRFEATAPGFKCFYAIISAYVANGWEPKDVPALELEKYFRPEKPRGLSGGTDLEDSEVEDTYSELGDELGNDDGGCYDDHRDNPSSPDDELPTNVEGQRRAARWATEKMRRSREQIAKRCPALARHLKTSVRTGSVDFYTYCYCPGCKTAWELD